MKKTIIINKLKCSNILDENQLANSIGGDDTGNPNGDFYINGQPPVNAPAYPTPPNPILERHSPEGFPTPGGGCAKFAKESIGGDFWGFFQEFACIAGRVG